MLSGRARWELTAEGNGTRLITTFDYALPGGVFGKIADALIVKRNECQKSQDRTPQLQGSRRTAIGRTPTGAAGFQNVRPLAGEEAIHLGLIPNADS